MEKQPENGAARILGAVIAGARKAFEPKRANIYFDNVLRARHFDAAKGAWKDLGIIAAHRKFTTV